MRFWPRWRTKFTMSNAGGTFTTTAPPKRYFAGNPTPSAEAVAQFCAIVAKNGVTSAQFAETVQGNAAAMFGQGETQS